MIQSNKEGYLYCDLPLFLPIAKAGEFEADAAGKFEAGVTVDKKGVLWYRGALKLGHLSPASVDNDSPPYWRALDEDDVFNNHIKCLELSLSDQHYFALRSLFA